MDTKSDGDGYAREEKERKTEVEVNGQHQARLDREGIIRQIDKRLSRMHVNNRKAPVTPARRTARALKK